MPEIQGTEKMAAMVGATGLAALLILGLALSSAVVTMLPSNVVSNRSTSHARMVIGHFLPQGWAFFTKAPNDPEIAVYAPVTGALETVSKFPNARAENLWGISREQRSQGPEMAALANAASTWVTCDDLEVGDDCLSVAWETLEPQRLENTSPNPTLCGPLLLSESVPVPWSFRDQYDGWRLDQRVTAAEVMC